MADIVVLNAGASAGRADHTSAVLSSVGALLFHGVNVMPGKPSCAAVTPDGKAVLGLPGYPVSCGVAAERLLRPLVAAHLGVAPPERERVRARIARKIPSKIGYEEALRVHVGRVGDSWTVTPLPRGAGDISSLSRANGLMVIPPLVEGYEPGQEVDTERRRSTSPNRSKAMSCEVGASEVTFSSVERVQASAISPGPTFASSTASAAPARGCSSTCALGHLQSILHPFAGMSARSTRTWPRPWRWRRAWPTAP